MLWNKILSSFGHAWCYYGLSPLKFRAPPAEMMEFPEGNASNCLCSVHRMAAGIDMPYQHASAARFETPRGALIFPRAQFWSQWLSQLWQWWAAGFSLCPRWGHGDHTQLSPGAGAWMLFHSGEWGVSFGKWPYKLRKKGGPREGRCPLCGGGTSQEAAALPCFSLPTSVGKKNVRSGEATFPCPLPSEFKGLLLFFSWPHHPLALCFLSFNKRSWCSVLRLCFQAVSCIQVVHVGFHLGLDIHMNCLETSFSRLGVQWKWCMPDEMVHIFFLPSEAWFSNMKWWITVNTVA